MTAPIFLNVEQLLDLIFAELPDDVYAQDRADNPDVNKRSYSSSELRAHSTVFATLYENLQDIYRDKFIVTLTEEGIAKWEKELFKQVQDGSLSYMQRQQNLLAKIRSKGGINTPSITSIVSGILDPLGLAFSILPHCGAHNTIDMYGAWVLDYSSLDWDTWLASIDPLMGTGLGVGQTPLSCSRDYAAAGLTLQEMIEIEETAYTYDVRIYGNADAATLDLLDKQLTAFEPARSTHVIFNNAMQPPVV